MYERLHPQDLRAILAGIMYGQGLQLIGGDQWQNVNDYRQTVTDVDALLLSLGRTSKPETVTLDREFVDRDTQRIAELTEENHALRARVEKAKALMDANSQERDVMRNRIAPIVAHFGITDWGSHAFVLLGIPEKIQALKDCAEGVQEVREQFRGLVDDLIAADYTPEPNCSCHLSPPCSDCVDFGAKREALSALRAAVELKPTVAEEACHG